MTGTVYTVPPIPPDAAHTTGVPPSAVPGQMRHGDSLGPCEGDAWEDDEGDD